MNMAERLQNAFRKATGSARTSYGRDVLARIIHGSRLSLSLSIFAMTGSGCHWQHVSARLRAITAVV